MLGPTNKFQLLRHLTSPNERTEQNIAKFSNYCSENQSTKKSKSCRKESGAKHQYSRWRDAEFSSSEAPVQISFIERLITLLNMKVAIV